MVDKEDVTWRWYALGTETHQVGRNLDDTGLLFGPGGKVATTCAFVTQDWDQAPDSDVAPRIPMGSETKDFPLCWRCVILSWVVKESDEANEVITRLDTIRSGEHVHDLLWRVQVEIRTDQGSVVVQAYEKGDQEGEVRRTPALKAAIEEGRIKGWVLD